jgi:hypothetical protein
MTINSNGFQKNRNMSCIKSKSKSWSKPKKPLITQDLRFGGIRPSINPLSAESRPIAKVSNRIGRTARGEKPPKFNYPVIPDGLIIQPEKGFYLFI